MASTIRQRGKKKTWWYFGHWNGIEYRESLHTTSKRQAEREQRARDAKYQEETYRKPKKITLGELIDQHLEWAEHWYRKGKTGRASQVGTIRQATGALTRTSLVATFGPQQLNKLRKQWIGEGKTRNTVNAYLKALKRMFSWGVEQGLVPADAAYAIAAVRLERKGRTAAKEPEARKAIPLEFIRAIQPYVSKPVWGLIQLQLATGARGDELFLLRPCDIDRSSIPWTFSPSHKTEYAGKELVKAIPAVGREALTPFMFRDPDAHLFDPREAEFSTEKAKDHYDRYSYRQAIVRGCARAKKALEKQGKKFEGWTPHRLRNTAGQLVEAALGREAAQVRLGHADARMTQHYTKAEAEKRLLLESTEAFDPLAELMKLEAEG